MNVNLHHLELFYYTAKAKGVSAAVKIIPYGIRQPALSQQLKQLETEIGSKLFDRKPFKMTPSGEKLFKFISKFFDNIEAEVNTIKDSSGLRIRFGCPSVISSNYLPDLVRKILEKYKHIRPFIHELDGNRNYNALLDKEIDIAISCFEPPKSRMITVKKLFTIPMALILPEDHRFLKGGFWPKADFATEKWIAIQEDSGGTLELLEGLSRLGISPEFVVSTNSIEAAMKYVEMKLGIALMVQPTNHITKQHKVAVLPLEPEIFGMASLNIAWRKDSEINSSIMTFIVNAARDIGCRYLS